MRLFFVAGAPTSTPAVAGQWGLTPGTLTLRNLTLRGGLARGGGSGSGCGGAGMGGAVFLMFGSLSLVNSTLSANSAAGGVSSAAGGGSGLGGALFNLDGSLSLLHCTLADNAVSAGTGAPAGTALGTSVYTLSFGTPSASFTPRASFTLENSVLWGAGSVPDLVNWQVSGSATVTATAPSIVRSQQNQGGILNAGGVLAADPRLDPVLKDNGVPTPTHLLLGGSAAVGVGAAQLCADARLGGLDQRGVPRVAPCALGAVEVRSNGRPCEAQGRQCISGFCADGVCCDRFVDRRAGQSKMSRKIFLEAMGMVWRMRLSMA